MLRKIVLAMVLGGTILSSLSSVYAADGDDKKKKKPKAPKISLQI